MGIAWTDKTDTILGYDKVSMYHYVWAIFSNWCKSKLCYRLFSGSQKKASDVN